METTNNTTSGKTTSTSTKTEKVTKTGITIKDNAANPNKALMNQYREPLKLVVRVVIGGKTIVGEVVNRAATLGATGSCTWTVRELNGTETLANWRDANLVSIQVLSLTEILAHFQG